MATRNIAILANAFYGWAALLGIPSLLGTLYFGFVSLQLYLATPTPRPVAPVEASNSALALLDLATRTISGIFGFLGAVGDAVARGLAVASILMLCVSATLYFIGRGLYAHAGWARGAAGLVLFVLLCVALLMALSAGPKGLSSLIGLLLAFCSGWGLWTLWRGFAV
jgi:hypothetical protein